MKAALAAGPRRVTRTEQVILLRIGGQLFAISAGSVQEIRSTDSIAGAATSIDQPLLKKVRQVIRRHGRTLYVIHGCLHFDLPVQPATLVFLLKDLRIALLVDGIERMATITRLHAVPKAFHGDEQHWYRGLVLMDNAVIPVIHPAGLLGAEEMDQLDAALAPVPALLAEPEMDSRQSP